MKAILYDRYYNIINIYYNVTKFSPTEIAYLFDGLPRTEYAKDGEWFEKRSKWIKTSLLLFFWGEYMKDTVDYLEANKILDEALPNTICVRGNDGNVIFMPLRKINYFGLKTLENIINEQQKQINNLQEEIKNIYDKLTGAKLWKK